MRRFGGRGCYTVKNTWYLDCLNHAHGRTKPNKQLLQYSSAAAPEGLSQAMQRLRFSTCKLVQYVGKHTCFDIPWLYMYVQDTEIPRSCALIASAREKTPACPENLLSQDVGTTGRSSSAARSPYLVQVNQRIKSTGGWLIHFLLIVNLCQILPNNPVKREKCKKIK